MWRIWSIGSFRGWRLRHLQSFPLSKKCSSGELGRDVPLHVFASYLLEDSRGPYAERLPWSSFYLDLNVGRLRSLDISWPRGRCLLESPWCPTLWLVIVLLEEPLFMWITDGWSVLQSLARILRYCDGWRLALFRSLSWPAVRPTVTADWSPSGRVACGRGPMDQFHRKRRCHNGSHLCHDRCVRVFLWKG